MFKYNVYIHREHYVATSNGEDDKPLDHCGVGLDEICPRTPPSRCNIKGL